MSKEISIESIRDLPEAIADIEHNLTDGALHISRGGLESPKWSRPLELASLRARTLASILRDLQVPVDWQKQTVHESYASLRPNLPKYLQEARELSEDLHEEARYGLRTSPPQKSPEAQAAVKRIRRTRHSLRRERYWVVNKLRGPDKRLSAPQAPVGDVRTIRGVYTRDSLSSIEDETKEEVCIPAGSVSEHEYLRTRQYRVWFGTNGTVNETSPTHGTDAKTLTLGSCLVYVPKTHKFGSLGSSWLSRVLRRVLRKEEDDRIQLKETSVFEPGVFETLLSKELIDWRRRTALIVVHGYNVSFKEAACRTAQIGFDLRVDGVTAFFSWPSRGKLFGYMHDEEAIQVAESHFVDFLKTIGRIPEVEEIHILAHSMGNRLLFGTVDRLIEASQAGTLCARIGQVILAAADVAVPLFLPRATSYQRLATRRVTSYSCEQDVALGISRELHGHDRVGLEPPVFVCTGIDSVSAAELDLHALGHSYYAETETVIYDIADVLHNDTPPGARLRLEPSTDNLYWILR